jgi:hypothetical protein
MVMTGNAMVTLAAILFLQPPGQSIHSRSQIVCDETCQRTPICSEPSLLCEAPKFSESLFNSKLDIKQQSLLTADQWKIYEQQVRFSSFTQAESYDEGVERYATIAEAVHLTAEKLSWRGINKKCKDLCTNAPFSDDCKSCQKHRPWAYAPKELEQAILTVFLHESGFRQDVHAGEAPLGRGDCKWMDIKTKKRTSPFAKNGTPIPGTCRSVCMGQINLGPDQKFGFYADDLVGTDLQHTMNCAEVTGRLLAQARNRCNGAEVGDIAMAMFSAYGTGGRCNSGGLGSKVPAKWALDRAKTYRRLKSAPTELSEKAKKALGVVKEEDGKVAQR